MAIIDIRELTVVADDGVELTAWQAGGGEGPVLVLCSGLIGDMDAWRELIDRLGPNHRIVGWEYRGLRGRGAGEPCPEVGRHARDLLAVCAATGVERAVVVGWSIGSRVALQAMAEGGLDVRALVLISGLFGRPLRDVLKPWLGPVARAAPWLGDIAAGIAPHAPAIWKAAGRSFRSRSVHDLLRLVGLVSETMPHQRLAELLADTARIELDRLLETLQAFDRHCADVELTDPGVPTLLISGRADAASPADAVMSAAEQLGGAQTMLVPAGGHLVPIEFAELLQLRMARFFRTELGYDALRRRTSARPAAV